MMARLRDELVYRVCNFMIMRVASRTYREKLLLLIRQGVLHADTGAGPFIARRDV